MRGHSGWYKEWPGDMDELHGCTGAARALAKQLHGYLDELGGFSVAVDLASSVGRRLAWLPSERQFLHYRLQELLSVGYVVVHDGRLSVPSWSWRQRDKNGKSVDTARLKEARRRASEPPASGTFETGIAVEHGSATTSSPPEVYSQSPPSPPPVPPRSPRTLAAKSVISLDQRVQKERKKERKNQGSEISSEDVEKWLAQWRAAFNVSPRVIHNADMVRCVEKAIARHCLQDCLDALTGYASDPWRHEDYTRHKVHVILGPGGTKEGAEDKVVLGLAKFAKLSPAATRKDPGELDREANFELLSEFIGCIEKAGDWEHVYPESFGVNNPFFRFHALQLRTRIAEDAYHLKSIERAIANARATLVNVVAARRTA